MRYVQHHVFENDWYKTKLQYREHFDIGADRLMLYTDFRSVQLLYNGPDGNPTGKEASLESIKKESTQFWKAYCFTEGKPLASELLLQFMDILGDRETQGRFMLLEPRPEDKSVVPT